MKSRSILVAFLVSLGVGSATYADGWLYWLEESANPSAIGMYRQPLQGGTKELVISQRTGLTIATYSRSIVIDDVGGKIYWREQEETSSATLKIMVSDLDGTNAGVFATVEPGNDMSQPLLIVRPPAAATVPAVSDIGLVVLVLCLLAAGGVVIARRSRVV